uniref:Uncharacterized protein n=1 Tax=Rhizophora mucronata TaxID=61149 RepID=A0A2P2PNT0_RHIMU
MFVLQYLSKTTAFGILI